MKRPPEPPPGLDKPRSPGGIRAFILAVVVHVAFFALIVFGVSWQSKPTAPVVAEIWDKLPPVKQAEKKAEPPAEPPKPEPPKPEPPKPEPPKPEPPKPEPPKPEPPKPDPPKPEPAKPPETNKPDPAIIEKLEREKREKEKRERLEREREEKKKQEEIRKKREEAEAARKKKVEEEARRAEEERVRREAEKAREAVAAARKAEFDKYIEQIRNRIRSKANVPDTVTGNPEVHMRLRILPGGEVLEATVTRSSGNRAYDQAIERAIKSAQPLPVPPANSELFHQFRDLNLNIRHER